MGTKGDKMSSDSGRSAELLLAKLEPITGITSRKMFGGHGIFHNDTMFGIIDSKGVVFLKANDSNKAQFEQRGGHKHSRMPYFSVPEEILNNHEELLKWSRQSIDLSK